MPLSPADLQQIATAAQALPVDAPFERFEDFAGRVLNLNPLQNSQNFPSPDPAGLKANAIASITKVREKIICRECRIPNFVVADHLGTTGVLGLHTQLMRQPTNAILAERLRSHDSIRSTLLSINQGHQMEAIAAAILNHSCNYGEATTGSGDQGIDCVAWKELILVDPLLSSVSSPVGEKVFLFASSKATTGGTPKLLNPAHVRELVGGWIIQRSTTGKWQSQGVQMLSAIQMILVTTYRLSTDARSTCKDLGIQVWGIPELVYLIANSAPGPVFDPNNGYVFSSSEFRNWWMARHTSRVMVA